MSVIKLIASSVLLFFCLLGYAQSDVSSMSVKDLKYLGQKAEYSGDLETASIFYQAFYDKKKSTKTAFRLAEMYRQIGNYPAAVEYYQVVFDEDKSKFPLAAFYLGRTLINVGKCDEATPILKDFTKDYRGKKDERKYIRLAKFSIAGCEKKSLGQLKEEKFLIVPLPSSVNGAHVEGAPIYYQDKLVYNSIKTNGKTVFEAEEDLPQRKFYQLKKENGEWIEDGEFELTKSLTDGEVANGAFNAEKSRFYFSVCGTNLNGNINCDIYRKVKKSGVWSEAEKLNEEINTKYSETQIAVGTDEKERETVYFVSDRPDGKGGKDIWYSTYYEKKDSYKSPRNLGSKVNSVGDEITPFISPVNRNLYFSSNGHPNYGGFDVFQSAGARSKWSEPENLGSFVNSPMDELYYVLNENGEEGIFVSNRTAKGKTKKYCCDDLFEFKEQDKIKVKLSGKVTAFDEHTKSDKSEKVVIKAYLINEEGEQFLVQSKKTDKDGNYQLNLEPNKNYVIKAEKEGFLVSSLNFSTQNVTSSKSFTQNFSLESYLNKSIIIENIYYKFDKSELTDDAKNTIDTTIYEIMVNNPSIVIELGSHTDSKGTDKYNEHLSQERAESVVKYLRKKGIAKERLTAKGYGEKMPIAANKNEDGSDNPEGRAKNRRTEFKVIGEIEDTEIEYED